MRPVFLFYLSLAFCLSSARTFAQPVFTSKAAPQAKPDTLSQLNSQFMFKQSSISPDTAKATLRVRIRDKSAQLQPVQGATVLLRRDDDKMLGRVTQRDGKCQFSAAPANYTVRVQMTGLQSFERQEIKLEPGKVYDMEIQMNKH